MEWSKFSDVPPPPPPADQRQRAWDGLQVEFIHSKLVVAAPTTHEHEGIATRDYPQKWLVGPWKWPEFLTSILYILRAIIMSCEW